MISFKKININKLFKISAFFLFFVFLFKLLVPITDLQGANNGTLQNKVSSEQKSEVFIKIVSQPAGMAEGLAIQTEKTFSFSSCEQITANSGIGLISQPDVINLNYPANCFSLGIQYSVSSQRELAVKPLEISKSILVVVNPSKVLKPSVTPASNSASFPIVPMVVLAIEVGLLYGRRIFLKNKVDVFIKTLKNALDLEQLQMLRC